jgi:hypothetical protein
MNDSESRKHQMFVRVQQFFSTRQPDFPAGSVGKQLASDLGATITELEGHAANEASSSGTARQGTVTRAEARAALRDDLEAINRTARNLDEVAGLHEQFRLPRGSNDQHLVNAARAFATDALPLKAQFIAHELPSDFIENLNADIAAFDAAISDQTEGLGDRIAATAAIDDAIERGSVLVRKLDTIVRNKYANNSAVLAEWTSKSHTERAPRKKTAAGTQPPAAPTGSPASPSTPSGS